MGTEDISRFGFDPVKRYAGVRMQQGRITLDDDWNENERIASEDARIERRDVIGDVGTSNHGFQISHPRLDAGGHLTFDIAAGTMYLGGLRVESFGDTFSSQDDWVNQVLIAPPDHDTDYLAWLEAWQQPVEAVEDDELLEKALGGPDTATRVRTMWRVHLDAVATGADCTTAWRAIAAKLGGKLHGAELVPSGTVQIEFGKPKLRQDLCAPPVKAGYLGAENQTIRIQISAPGRATWGFDDASPLYRVVLGGTRKVLELRNLPRDQAHWLVAGQVVEVLPWSAVLPNGEKVAELTGTMAKVTKSYDPDTHLIEIDTAVPVTYDTWQGRDHAKTELGDWTIADPDDPRGVRRIYYFLRVWDRGDDRESDADFPIGNGIKLDLGHTGLVAAFHHTQFLPGDHWIAAVRPDTPDLIVPWALHARPRPPHGVRRFYAPLGIVHWKQSGSHTVHDCRPTFTPLARLRGCCTYTVGNNTASVGQFSSISAAVAALPADGGRICLLPGTHTDNVELDHASNVTIEGCCGTTTVVPKDPAKPVFAISGSRQIRLTGFAITSDRSEAIVVTRKGRAIRSGDLAFTKLTIGCRDTGAIRIEVGVGVRIEDCAIAVARLASEIEGLFVGRAAAVFVTGRDVAIERNRIVAPSDARFTRIPYGGIQIGGGSSRVAIRRNRVTGGHGHAITLGSVIYVPKDQLQRMIDRYGENDRVDVPAGWGWTINDQGCIQITWNPPPPPGGGGGGYVATSAGSLDHLRIVDNDLDGCGHAGIGVARYFTDQALQSILTDDLEIADNRITSCLRVATVEIPEDVRDIAAYGAIALADGDRIAIRNNTIEGNGISHLDPVCGVFALAAGGIDLIGNRITTTPPRDDATSGIKAGWRGGIVVAYATPPDLDGEDFDLGPGAPAARVLHNVVVHEEGRALVLLGDGPMTIAHNELASHGIANASAAFDGVYTTAFEGGLYSNATYRRYRTDLLAGNRPTELSISEESTGDGTLWSYEHKGAGRYLDFVGDRATTSPTIGRGISATYDYIGGCIALVFQHGPPHDAPPRDIPNDIPRSWTLGLEAIKRRKIDIVRVGIDEERASLSISPPAIHILFHGNRATLDVAPRTGVGVAVSAIALYGGGDVSATDNQVHLDLSRAYVYTDLWVRGGTAGASDNALIETGQRVTLSASVIGRVLAAATSNRASHCIHVQVVGGSTPTNTVNRDNVIENADGCESLLKFRELAPLVGVILSKR